LNIFSGEDGFRIKFNSMLDPEFESVVLRFDNLNSEISIDFVESNLISPFNRWLLRFISTEDEYIWGGGEQYSFFNLREGGNYPIWVREQGVGRNKSSALTQVSLYRHSVPCFFCGYQLSLHF